MFVQIASGSDRGPRRSRRAAAVVETAFVLPLAMLLMMGIFEYGRFMMARHLIANSAREGARLASAGIEDYTTTQIQDLVLERLSAIQLTDLSVAIYRTDGTGADLGAWTDAAFGQGIAVKVNANFHPIVPSFGILPNPVPLEALSIFRSEAD
jgi:Flp pilus assembly protein TadG